MILTGAPGSGKSSVLDALCTLLEIDEVSFGAIESEYFSRGWPWLSFSEELAQLAAIVELQREAGRDTFLVVVTTEDEQDLRATIAALGADQVIVVCLTAPPAIVAERVACREPDAWPGKARLIEHSRLLAEQIPAIPGIDARYGTVDRTPFEVARDIRELLAARWSV